MYNEVHSDVEYNALQVKPPVLVNINRDANFRTHFSLSFFSPNYLLKSHYHFYTYICWSLIDLNNMEACTIKQIQHEKNNLIDGVFLVLIFFKVENGMLTG